MAEAGSKVRDIVGLTRTLTLVWKPLNIEAGWGKNPNYILERSQLELG